MRTTRDTVALGPFTFEHGGRLPELDVAYETYGEYDGDNAVLVCHALTGSANVAGDPDGATAGQARAWWDDVVGPGEAVDTDEYYVVCVNVPGSCYGTTGPASIDPRTGEPYGPDFPAVTVGDWTRVQRLVLERLGVDRLRAVTGGSVGGMNALEWAKRFPAAVETVAPIASGPRLDPQCLALNAIAARAITSDPDWRGGRYYGDTHPDDGLALARMIGHVMYLSKDSMHAKFGRRPSPADAPTPSEPPAAATPLDDAFPYRAVASYLDYNAAGFVERFDANSYLSLLRAMDNYDLAAGVRSDAAALADFEGEALLVSFTGDWHFPAERAARLAESFRAAGVPTAHRVIDSPYGHDAFLAQPDRVAPPLGAFLEAGTSAFEDEGDDADDVGVRPPAGTGLCSD